MFPDKLTSLFFVTFTGMSANLAGTTTSFSLCTAFTPGLGGYGFCTATESDFGHFTIAVTSDDTCDIGEGPNDIETVTASYDGDTDEIVVEMFLCVDADNRTSYRVYFDHQGGIDDGPDTLDPNPGCERTWDDYSLPSISMVRLLASAALGMRTVRIPLSKSALTPSTATDLGSVKALWKLP